MRKNTSIFFAVLLTLNLVSCSSNPKECSHVDSNKDHVCDLCETTVGEHKDLNNDGKCDYCGDILPIVKSVSITNAPTEIMVDDQITLTAEVITVGGASDKVIWSTDKNDIATINENGLLTALSAGNVIVTAKAKDNNEVKDSVTIIVKEKGWSESAKQLMFSSFGMYLPYLNETWSEPELMNECIVSSSETGNLNQLKTIFTENDYEIQDVVFPYNDSGSNAPGFVAIKNICDEGYVTVEIGDFSLVDEGYKLKAYSTFTSWPASIVEKYLDGVEGTVPEVEATSYKVKFFKSTVHVYCYEGNLEEYFSILSSSYYIDKTMSEFGKPYLDYSTYFAENFIHTIQIGFLEYNNYFIINPFTTSPIKSKTNWDEEEISVMQDVLGETLPFINAEFVISEGELNNTISLTSYSLRIGAFEMAAKVFSEDDSWSEEYDSDSLLYTFTKTSSAYEEKIIVVTICHELGQCYFNAYCVDPELRNWPAQAIADYIDGHTIETVPSWDGILFIVSYYVQTYKALIIDGAGDANDYIVILQQANWDITDNTDSYGYYECISPNGTLTIAVFPQHSTFQIQLLINK